MLAIGLLFVAMSSGIVTAACDDDDSNGPRETPFATTTSALTTTAPAPTPDPTISLATAATPPNGATPAGTPAPVADTSVAVTLSDYVITLDRASAPVGRVRFIATNVSAEEVHELAVLKIQPDGSFQERGTIEAVDPQQGGSVTLTLEAGAYQLACRIKPGESGSEVDHYLEGMRTDFTVE